MADDKYNEKDEQGVKEKYSWSDKSRQERVQHKMLFLVFLAVLFLFTAFIYFKSDARNNSEESRGYESNEEENDDVNYSEKANEIADKYKNDDKDDEGRSENQDDEEQKESTDEDEPEVISRDANEYEEEYLEKYSRDLIEGLKKNSKVVMDMYFEKDFKNKSWEKIATDEFIKDIENNLSEDEQKVISYEIFATKKYNNDEIIIGVVSELEDDVFYYNLIYKEKDNQVKLNDIVFMW